MLRGDLGQLRRLAAALRAKPVGLAQRVARDAAPRLTSQILRTFDARQNAYGDAWDGEVDLVKSGRLRSTLSFTAVGTIVRAVLGVPYARYLIGKYRMLPPGGSKMPGAFEREIRTVADLAFSREYGDVA